MAQHPATRDTTTQHDQAGTSEKAAESASIDVAAITTTIGRVLRPRPGTPARRTCERWHELLKGHLQLLVPIMQKDAEPFAGTDYAELIELAAPLISARVAAPQPAVRSGRGGALGGASAGEYPGTRQHPAMRGPPGHGA